MNAELLKAYTAGLFDGEGCITISGNRKAVGAGTYQLVTQVHMCDEEPLHLLCERWGGVVRAKKPNNSLSRPSYRWRLYGGAARDFLRDIRPYLQIERVQIKADLAIAFQDQKRVAGSIKPPARAAYSAIQRHYYEVMRDLNRRGAAGLDNTERARIADFESQLRLVA